MRRDLRFWAICLALFLVGSGLRLSAGAASWSWFAGAHQGLAPASAVNRELSPEAVQHVLDFYRAVDKGRYADAYAASLENHWLTGETLEVDQLTAEDEFVTALTDELGANGMSLNIIAIQPVTGTVLLRDELDAVRYPELTTLDYLPAGVVAGQLGRVELVGTLLGRCSRWDWQRDVIVAEMPGQGWRLLLPGVRKAHGLHHADWFLPHE